MKTRTEHVLGWVDRLLLVAVAGLVFLAHRDLKHLAEAFGRPSEPVAAVTAPPPQPEYVMAASRHTISISPGGGVTESRVSRMARSLSTEVGWEGAPVSQAADMRERDGLYDIAFALSRQLDERTVRVTTDGNLLTLTASALGNPHAQFAKQFYIPCDPARIGPVEANVSNGVVRVRIQPEVP